MDSRQPGPVSALKVKYVPGEGFEFKDDSPHPIPIRSRRPPEISKLNVRVSADRVEPGRVDNAGIFTETDWKNCSI
jgi:hypothetical protein